MAVVGTGAVATTNIQQDTRTLPSSSADAHTSEKLAHAAVATKVAQAVAQHVANIDKEGPLIVAELSGNHQGDLDKAISLMDLAHQCGADMVKIQTYTEDSLTIASSRPEFQLTSGLWKGYSYYDLYKEAKTPREWMDPLFKHAREQGIVLFSSPFCPDDVDVLEKAGCPIYKIASFELNYPQLIAYCAQTGKPLVMSTGLATLEEIDAAVQVARDNGCQDLTILHCESHYPAEPSMFNLRSIPFFKERYQCKVGLSNHAIGNVLDIAATALGADMIEKHFALDRNTGIDAAFSMTPDELKALKQDTLATAQALGIKGVRLSELDWQKRSGRRSVYLVKDLKAGETLTIDHVKIIRPDLGLDPYKLNDVLGHTAKEDLKAPLPLKLSSFN